MTCIFCHIIERRLPAEIIYEDKEITIFKDVNPAAPVHLLIVPKKHIDSLNALKEKDADLIKKMVLVAKMIAEKQGIQNGYRLMINNGREAGQVVYHLHMHLLGGWGKNSKT